MMKKGVVLLMLMSLLSVVAAVSTSTSPPAPTPSDKLFFELWKNMREIGNGTQDANKVFNQSAFIRSCTSKEAPPSVDFVLGASALIVAMLIALAAMAGYGLNIPHLTAFAKNELGELIFTFVLISMVFTYLKTFPLIFGVSVFDVVIDYNLAILARLAGSAAAIISSFLFLSFLQALFLPLSLIGRSITILLGPALRPVMDLVVWAVRGILASYGMWVAHLILFCMFKEWFFTFFLCFAFMFRIFPLTRGFGNALIAVILALIIAYPFMFYLDKKILDTEQNPRLSFMPLKLPSILSKLSNSGVAKAFVLLFTALIIFITAGMAVLAYIAGTFVIACFKVTVKTMFIYSLVLPAINAFVTLTFAREMAKHLGSDLAVGHLLRLI